MRQPFPDVVRSTLFGCLLLSSSLIPLPAAVAIPPILPVQSETSFPDAKTIAEQVRQEAIAKEKLDSTAKVIQIDRVGKGEMWMYNPVPYWKITIADRRQRLVYFTTQTGHFRALVQRNGQNVHSPRQPAQEIPPPEMLDAAMRQARLWGYPGRPWLTNVSAEKTQWGSGCENVSAPYACDPVLRQGWKITVPYQSARWVFRGERADALQLIERSNPVVERRLPTPVQAEIKRLAGKHVQLPPAAVLITRVERQNFSDSCLGLGTLVESCAQQIVPGYRVTVIGKSRERQIYRISEDTKLLRTEAQSAERYSEGTAGLPMRTDELPTAIARKVFNAAQVDFKHSIANLSITQVEPTLVCFRNPAAAPTEPCQPMQRINGWKVTVTDYEQSRIYTVDLNGTILSKS